MFLKGICLSLEVLEGEVCLVSTLLDGKTAPLLLPSSCTAVNPQGGVKGDLEFIISTTSVMSDLDISRI